MAEESPRKEISQPVEVQTAKVKVIEETKATEVKAQELKDAGINVQTGVQEIKTVPTAPPFRIVPSSSKKRTHLNMMLYGKFGVGKTLLACSAQDVPEMQNVIYIEADGGDKVLRRRGDIDEIEFVRDYNKIGRIFEFLRKHCYYRDKNDTENLIRLESTFRGEKVKEPKIYNTVVIDTLNEIQTYCMNQILGINTDNWKLDAEPIVPAGEDWGTDLTMIRWLVRSFRDLPMHTIFICAEDTFLDKAKQIHIQPALPGKLASAVQGFLDNVGYYHQFIGENNTIHRRLYFTPGSNYPAKNRWEGWNGTSILDPTMKTIYEIEKQYG
jgi:hypothetical protein